MDLAWREANFNQIILIGYSSLLVIISTCTSKYPKQNQEKIILFFVV